MNRIIDVWPHLGHEGVYGLILSQTTDTPIFSREFVKGVKGVEPILAC